MNKVLVVGGLFVIGFLGGCAHTVDAQSLRETITDPTDGGLDLSVWLATKRGFMPVPILITEPALGYGLGAVVLFLKDPGTPPTAEEVWEHPDPGGLLPPTVSGGGGFYTENGSWMGFAFHMASWSEDRWRYTGAVGGGDLNLKFFGLEEATAGLISGAEFSLDNLFLYQALTRRIAGTDLFVGASYVLLGSDVAFSVGGLASELPPLEDELTSGGLGILTAWDSRDNTFTPNRGLRLDLKGTFFEEWLGSDTTFQRYQFQSLAYFQLADDWNLGWRVDLQRASGEVPFYLEPFLNIRGIPAMRYQGEVTALTELEARWRFLGRWSLVGFAGVGRAATSFSDLGSATDRWAGGAGFRYLVARRYGVHAGADIARGPEEWAFYLTVGSAWNAR